MKQLIRKYFHCLTDEADDFHRHRRRN